MEQKIIKINTDGTIKQGPSNFCSAPWTTIWHGTNGDVKVCCASREILGNLKTEPMENIINNDAIKELRKQFLNNERPETCVQCWERERGGKYLDNSRHLSNRQSIDVIQDSVNNCLEDGTITKQNLKFVDLIWTNKCNFACLHCKPSLSTSIADNYESVFSIWIGKKEQKLFDEYSTANSANIDNRNKLNHILDNCSELTEIHFNGGEPFMQEETFELITELQKRKLNNQITLWFHTNGSIRSYKDVDIVQEYLKPWGRKCKITMSHDHFGDRGRYFRYGYSESKWLENFDRFHREGIDLAIQVSLTLFNLPTLSQLQNWYFDHNIHTRVSGCKVSYIVDPIIWNFNNLSYLESIKQHTIEEIQKCKPVKGWVDALNNSVRLLNQPFNHSVFKEKFVRAIDALDAKRKTNFVKTFPELNELYFTLKELGQSSQ